MTLSRAESRSAGSEYRLRKLLMFAAVGVAATAIQYCILIFCVEICKLPPTVGSGMGFVVSAAANYLVNYHVTFRSSRTHLSAASRFATVASIGLLINLGLMQLLTARWGLQYVLAQAIATVVVFLWNFCGSA